MARAAGGHPELEKFVAEALLKRNKSYEELKSLLRECRKRVEQEPDSEEGIVQLTTLIGCITANVSAIHERKHESIVSDLLSIKLWNTAPAVLSAVLDFTRNLVVANSAFTHSCLQLIVYSFTPPPEATSPGEPSEDLHGPWRPSEQALAVHQSLLPILVRVLALVPTAPTNVLPLIVSQMPHKLQDRNKQCLYLSALFRIAEDRTGAPIREALLTAVVEHLLSMDVEIKWEDIVDVPTASANCAEVQHMGCPVVPPAGQDSSSSPSLMRAEDKTRFNEVTSIQRRDDPFRDPTEVPVCRVGGKAYHQEAAMVALSAALAPRPFALQRTIIVMERNNFDRSPPAKGEEAEEEQDDVANEDVFELEEMLAKLARRHAMLAMRQGAARNGRGGWEGAVAGAHGQQEEQPATPTRPPVDEMANKMDSMMELAFEHLQKRIAAGELRQLWDTLLSCFERTILNTHRSKFTQFLLFYVCIHNPGHCSQSLAPITRAACAAYLASFLARAAFVPETVVVKTLQELASFSLDYCRGQSGGLSASSSAGNLSARTLTNSGLQDSAALMALTAETANAQTQRHQMFYAAVQAILYVLCYHMQALVGDMLQQQQSQERGQEGATDSGEQTDAHNKGNKDLAESVLLNHRLQPLGVCLPSVAAEFIHQAASLGVVDLQSLLTQVEPETRSQRPLEMFFPFDPYLLRRSSRFLQLKQSYVRWRHGHPQTAAGGTGAEVADSEDDEGEEADGRGSDGEDQEPSPSNSEDEGEESDDEDMAGRSMPSDAMLHDPTNRLHAGAAGSSMHHARGVSGATGSRPHGRGKSGSAVMGTSYMSYASTASQEVASPYGMSPHDGGDMLVNNPLGSSPGVVPMSLGTPEMHFMSQDAMILHPR
ncbi:hypothetical protein VOLCADRAFT_120872 [Volvox carteri f. nagariensis]|uniref:RNA polymerase I-specific transcription initiation factor RRN3 n=1 Tax=Volvox carteri f. nagariensis TaxID=3068 RepID=D8TV59_VOLCA|nr:uncharacterized protein VOLCADRAFT_120872 [Volvox carteri f. nagariensis]EFJ48520.1 hypothetical protein VOLCADRAFT_120872 [Volvox carteri f. nagariensis]|eukprot:XP_002950319.1 hypothetical protein VOLCADRAFT_120872 [Volvox carteri f. nagariensis]